MDLNKKKKEIKIYKLSKDDLKSIFRKFEEADFPQKDIENISDKLKSLVKAGLSKDNLNAVTHKLIMGTGFRLKFLKLGNRKIPRLLAEYGIKTELHIPQVSRQAESNESFGFQFPYIAVDPTGKFVAQIAITNPQGNYRVEIYKLEDHEVFHHKILPFHMKGDIFSLSSNNRGKGLTFSSDGRTLWVSVGTKPIQGPFKTWLIKINTTDWTHEAFGPVHSYEYFNQLFSRAHFRNIKLVKDSEIEKLLSPVYSYRDLLVFFNPRNPMNVETWNIDKKPGDRPNYFTRFTDIAVIGSWVYAAGWAENAAIDGIKNPRASLVILDLNNRSVEYGPYYIPEMMGHYDHLNNSIWSLKIRPTPDGAGAFLIAEKLAPKNTGGTNPDHTGFAYFDIQTGNVVIKDNYYYNSADTRFQSARDILNFGDKTYLHILKQDFAHNFWNGLILLNENLSVTSTEKGVPTDWWNRIYFEPHPTRSQDVLISAVRPIFHPNNPSGLVAIWEAF